MNKLIQFLKADIKHVLKSFFDKDFSILYNSGIDAYVKGDYEQAISLFKGALKEKNIQPQVYYNLALCYQFTENYDRAITTYQKFLTLNPTDYDGIYNLALVYFETEKYKHAIEFFEKSIKIKKEPENVKALTLAYLCNNEMQKAIDFAEGILKNTSNGLDLYFNIAKVFENKNPFNKEFTLMDIAIEMYSKIITMDSRYFDAYLAKSICYAKKGEWESSVEFCKQAIEVNPKSYEANNQMGLVYYCCDKLEEAVYYYEQALAINPKSDFKIYSNLAYAYEKIGDNKKAIKTFSQLISKFPEFPALDEIKNHLRILKSI